VHDDARLGSARVSAARRPARGRWDRYRRGNRPALGLRGGIAYRTGPWFMN